jgi:hypothetical protein
MLAGRDLPLLRRADFQRFGLGKLLHLLAQNALVYGIFIIVVSEQESALATSAFVLTATIPSVLLSIPGGVVADALPRKLTMLAALGARVALAAWLLEADPGIPAVVAATFAVFTALQFYGPAESSALAAIVEPARMGAANSMFNAITLVSQVAGAGIVAPLALKAFGDRGLFGVVFILFAFSGFFFFVIPGLTPGRASAARRERVGLLRAFPRGWHAITTSPTLARVTTLMVLLDSALLMIVVAVPSFITDVLRTPAPNAVYIFAPGAIGVIVGLVITPGLLKVMPARLVVTVGFILVVGTVLTLPFIVEVSEQLDEHTAVPLQQVQDWLRVRREIAATALLLPFGGMGMTMVRVAARTAVYDEAAPNEIAQVFATQSAIGSVVSLAPTLGAGLLVDVLDVRAVLVITGIAMAGIAVLALSGRLRRAPGPQVAPA